MEHIYEVLAHAVCYLRASRNNQHHPPTDRPTVSILHRLMLFVIVKVFPARSQIAAIIYSSTYSTCTSTLRSIIVFEWSVSSDLELHE